MTADKFKEQVISGAYSQPELAELYEKEVFPQAMGRMREWAEDAMGFDTLYLTAGTQPFSQALSIVATPADKVVFIATDDPLCQECVKKAIVFSGLKESEFEVLTFSEPFSAAEMTKAVFYHIKGSTAKHIAVDITSGRKVMSAALSSIASELELPQFYLNAEYLRGGFAVNEQRMSVPSVAALVRQFEMDVDEYNGTEENGHV